MFVPPQTESSDDRFCSVRKLVSPKVFDLGE
jgi:hypothetical protein